ncbi:MAG: ABC transporter ATP-binding protein [Gemmatimonadetes bacterium]|nr:ABC transporter ATP-binding protein [Gemmatimonadota bacterium]
MIEATRLSYTYRKRSAPAVRGLDFAIDRGEIFGFLGPSGAGKSTTQRILIGLLRDYGGAVTVFERSLKDWRADYFERIGVSFEVPNHYLKLTACENLRYFGSLYRGDTLSVPALLEMVGLQGDGDLRVSQYSKGMKVRLGVARALLHRPELLFLDEPTAGLDPGSTRRIKELIKHQRDEGKTVFLTTHDMTVADELCDRVAFIVEGEIRLVDRPRDLKLRYGESRVRVEYEHAGATECREFPLAGLGENTDFLNVLRHRPVQTIHTAEATLEDIFIEVTGRALE